MGTRQQHGLIRRAWAGNQEVWVQAISLSRGFRKLMNVLVSKVSVAKLLSVSIYIPALGVCACVCVGSAAGASHVSVSLR